MIRSLFAAILTLAPTLALAQSAVLSTSPWTNRHAPMYYGQGAGQAVVTDSGPAGGGANLGLSEQALVVIPGTGTGPWAGTGTGPFGTNWCDYDNFTNSSAGYHYLCLSPNANGGALIAVGAVGTSSQPLTILVNGIAYPFPGALAGITIGTTPVSGGTTGDCLVITGAVVGQASCGASAITQLTGDVTAVGPGSVTATLASVNPNTGTFGGSATVPVITVNGKGLITAASNVNLSLVIGTTPIVGGNTGYLLYNNGGAVGNEALASIISPSTGLFVTGSTAITIGCSPATTSALGCVQPDGTIITVSGGAISVAKATSSTYGVIKGDASTITIGITGIISCTTATSSQIGCVRPDNTTITISGGVISSTATASSITVGTTSIVSGTTGYVLTNNSGVLGNSSAVSLLSAGGGIGITGSTTATIAAVTEPRGRLTLQSSTPVMTTTQAAQTTVYYDCFHGGNQVPVYNGSNDIVLPIGSCEISTSLVGSGTGEVLAAGVFDVWAVNVSSTLTLCVATNGSGGGWASDAGGSNTARGTGYSKLDFKTRPYITNANAIATCYNGTTNEGSIGANQATYLGTFYTSGNGQVSWTYPTVANPPVAGLFGLWNAYSRVSVVGTVGDNAVNWTYGSTTVREVHGGTTSSIAYVRGLTEDQTFVSTLETISSGSGFAVGGLCYNATNAFTGTTSFSGGGSGALVTNAGSYNPIDIGFNTVNQCEAAITATFTAYGSDETGSVASANGNTSMTLRGSF